MPADPALVKETRSWLQKASTDLRAAQIDLSAEPALLEDALFHCQQAAEKTLKALLTFHNQRFRRTHSLEELGEACLSIAPTLKAPIDEAVPLTEFAWAYRYPGDPPPPLLPEALDALQTAKSLFEEILRCLPPEAHP